VSWGVVKDQAGIEMRNSSIFLLFLLENVTKRASCHPVGELFGSRINRKDLRDQDVKKHTRVCSRHFTSGEQMFSSVCVRCIFLHRLIGDDSQS